MAHVIDRAKKTVAEYLDDDGPTEQYEAVEDPSVRDVVAVRVMLAPDNEAHFLVHPDNEVEEVEFTQWPPRSGGLNLF